MLHCVSHVPACWIAVVEHVSPARSGSHQSEEVPGGPRCTVSRPLSDALAYGLQGKHNPSVLATIPVLLIVCRLMSYVEDKSLYLTI